MKTHTSFLSGLILSCLTLILLSSLTAQQEALHAIQIKQLPQPTIFPTPDFENISVIRQEANGILWLATNRGLFSFDGAAFRKKLHDPDGFSAIDNGAINDLFLDQATEKLWVAHNQGASALDLQTATFTDYTFHQYNQPNFTDDACDAVFKDRQGNIWFGITSFGLVRLDTALHFFHMKKKAASDNWQNHPTIYQIAQDLTADSILWLATPFVGLVRFSMVTGQYTFPTYPDDGPAGGFTLTAIFPEKDNIFCGNMWVHKSHIFDLKTTSLRKISFPSSPGTTFPLSSDDYQPRSERTIWGRGGYGLFVFDRKSGDCLAYLPYPQLINSFGAGFLATPQRLWFSSVEGLVTYDLGTYQVENHVFPKDEKNKPDILSSVLEKKDGTGLWLGFQLSEFIYDYDPSRRTMRRIPYYQGDWGLIFIRLDNGRILAVNAIGIHELKNDRLTRLPLLQNLAAKKIEFGLPIQDRKGNLWLGSRWGGLYRIDLQTGQYENVASGLPIRGLETNFKDSRDNIYMSGSGFFVYNAVRDTILYFPYQPGDSLTTYSPKGYVEDDEGNIWLSDVRVGGLMVFDPDRMEAGILRKYDAHNGSFSNQMLSLAKDRQGRIWAVTKAGLQVFDPRTESFRLFGEAAGLRLRDKNTSSNFTPSYLTTLSSGKMLVGYKDGFAIFHPDSLTGNQELPKPYFRSVFAGERALVKGKSFGNSEIIALQHHENLLEFEFSSIAYLEPAKITYRYRLLGFNEDWLETSHRQVRYTHLPPDSYTFQLQALNSDGLHTPSPLEWHFEIRPPWWATWWAYLGYVLLALMLALAFYFYKKRQWQLKSQLALEHREAERLKELDAVKTKLYTNITHEFRTPLTIILGMAKQVRDNPKDWFREGLKMIIRNGNNLLHLVNQMLDLSKLESGAMPVNLIQGDILTYLKYVMESFHSLAESKNIRLHFQTDLKELRMDYDPEKVLNIVSNLLSNAIKFTLEGGDVYFQVDVSASSTSSAGSTLLKIKDTGIGIPPEKLPHIFDRFYQADDAATRKAEGTGIGLALTKELVKLLDGKIAVESEEGKGTQFTVELPISNNAPLREEVEMTDIGESTLPFTSTAADKEVMVAEETAYLQERPVLLIIEDNADVVQYLKSLLAKDYRMEVAVNGQEGLDKALELVPDIIISDVMMPVMDGFELCDKLKKDMRTSHIPIIMLTAKADISSKIEGLERGADAYLAKPFHKQELLIRLQKLVDLRKLLQARYNTLAPLVPSEDLTVQIEDAFMVKLRDLLETHFSDENFGIPDLCQTLLMSRAQLYRKVAALTGKPAASYLRSFRLQKAKELLQSTSLTVSEIAFQVGFKDLGHFSRTFLKEFGKNPSDLRN